MMDNGEAIRFSRILLLFIAAIGFILYLGLAGRECAPDQYRVDTDRYQGCFTHQEIIDMEAK